MEGKHAVTQALISASSGDREAADLLWQLTYDELRRIAQHHISRERAGHTLTATELVHEAYVRLVDQTRISWKDRSHFFSIASQACRRVLVDHARRRLARKRGSGVAPITLNENAVLVDEQTDEILAVNRALERLAALDERLHQVVEHRYFGGLTEEETAEALGISARTVRRDWTKAKAWLMHELRSEPDAPGSSADGSVASPEAG